MEETDARMISSPAVHASFLIRVMASKGMTSTATDATMLHDVIAHKIAQVNAGDLTEVEGMLMAGACTMQAVSSEFIRRASLCLDNPNAAEIYMRIGLKAAGQIPLRLPLWFDRTLPIELQTQQLARSIPISFQTLRH